jgi:hypothetical protein
MRDGVAIDGKGSGIWVPCGLRSCWGDFIDTTIVGDKDALQQAFVNRQQIIIVSDGSVKDNHAAAAWIMTTELLYDSGTYITGRAKVPGKHLDSHRAECFGILGGLQLLLSWLKSGNFASSEANISFACDNQSALRYSFDTTTVKYIGFDTPDFDVIQSNRFVIHSTGLNVHWRHVKGHQTGADLDIWARLNNTVDLLAGNARDDTSLICPPPTVHIEGEKWQVLRDGDKIYKDGSSNLFDYCTKPQVKETFNRYERVHIEGFDLVDWQALEHAMNTSTVRQRQWISKRAARDCGCNYIRCKRRERETDGCPFCGECETVVHVLKCTSDESRRLWESAILELQQWLDDKSTDPFITESLISGLRSWRNDPEGVVIPGNNPLLAEQTRIGWNSVLEGVFGLIWQQTQTQFFRKQNSLRSGQRWMSQLIRRIWKIPWDLWQLRNQKEHLQDYEKMLDRLRLEVQDQVHQGHNNFPDLVHLFSESEIETITSLKDVQYVRAWLRNVRAGRRRGLLRQGTRGEMDQMRAVMRAFLQ